jgi:hypothetical protein
MTETVGPVDLLVRDAELLVTMTGEELHGGWVAIKDGFVKAVGGGAWPEPRSASRARSGDRRHEAVRLAGERTAAARQTQAPGKVSGAAWR